MDLKERFITTKAKSISVGTYTRIIVDKETGVNYLYVSSGTGGGLTPLLDVDGKPIIRKPKVGEELYDIDE